MKISIIGCGLTGSSCARILKDKGHKVTIFESRDHIGGNCYDYKIGDILVHPYGPHIFHTDDEEVYEFLSRFTDWFDFFLRPKGHTKIGLLSLPYSLTTVREIGRELSKEEIIDIIFKDYSEKQWGMPFSKIPSCITKRIPDVKKVENPTWFEGQKYQCIPKFGYAKMFEEMLRGIDIELSCPMGYSSIIKTDLVINTGKIDAFFNFIYGKLPYRSLLFNNRVSHQKMPFFVKNYNISSVPFTRVYDNGFLNYDSRSETVITEELPVSHDDSNPPFYPIPTYDNLLLYERYRLLSLCDRNFISIGRLGSYEYLDMWKSVKKAIDFCKEI